MKTSPTNACFSYFQYIEDANDSLCGVKDFCFYPGMLFGSREKWWPDSGTRPTSHEGIDICYYTDNCGREHKFASEMNIPVMAQGRIFAFCQDFLGHSVFLDHGVHGVLRFFSVYAHIVPLPHLFVGVEMQPGEVVGRVADTTGRKNRMPAHVHISLMKVPQTVTAGMLDWDFICNSEQVLLIDPLSMMRCEAVNFCVGKPFEMRGQTKS